jgi:hypothetical protein
MNNQRITGGIKSFASAVNKAFTANMNNPAVKYSHAVGFYAESDLIPSDPDVLWCCSAYYDGDGNRSMVGADYQRVRAQILGIDLV